MKQREREGGGNCSNMSERSARKRKSCCSKVIFFRLCCSAWTFRTRWGLCSVTLSAKDFTVFSRKIKVIQKPVTLVLCCCDVVSFKLYSWSVTLVFDSLLVREGVDTHHRFHLKEILLFMKTLTFQEIQVFTRFAKTAVKKQTNRDPCSSVLLLLPS